MDGKLLVLVALGLSCACKDETSPPRAPGGPGAGIGGSGSGGIKPSRDEDGGDDPDAHTGDASDGLDCSAGERAQESLGFDNADPWPATSTLAWEKASCPTPRVLIDVATACGEGSTLQISLDSEAIESSQILMGSRAVDAADPYVRLRLTSTSSSATWTLCETASGILTLDSIGIDAGDRIGGTVTATLLDCASGALPRSIQVRFESTVEESIASFCGT